MERVQQVLKQMETYNEGGTVIHWYGAALNNATSNSIFTIK